MYEFMHLALIVELRKQLWNQTSATRHGVLYTGIKFDQQDKTWKSPQVVGIEPKDWCDGSPMGNDSTFAFIFSNLVSMQVFNKVAIVESKDHSRVFYWTSKVSTSRTAATICLKKAPKQNLNNYDTF